MSADKKVRMQSAKISEQMKIWSSMLAGELEGWPNISSKRLFGSTAYYRKGVVFAALPKTRGMNSANSFIFKIPDVSPRVMARLEGDGHIHSTVLTKARWFSYEVESDADLRGALEWLGMAYEAAGKKA